jgi:hypothetical protein
MLAEAKRCLPVDRCVTASGTPAPANTGLTKTAPATPTRTSSADSIAAGTTFVRPAFVGSATPAPASTAPTKTISADRAAANPTFAGPHFASAVRAGGRRDVTGRDRGGRDVRGRKDAARC